MEVVKKYTDENYIAINDLHSFGEGFLNEIKKYRNSFIEMIPLNDLDFVKITETPALIKKRYIKNIELKGLLKIDAQEYDYILELAKQLANGKDIKGIDQNTKNKIINKYSENGNDLTIITNYLINNVDKIISFDKDVKIESIFPELSKNDQKFISQANNINLNYSISNYQQITKCSYETGRKSLEKLVKLELFIKKKVGKKFVYKPTEKLEVIIKGGN